MSILYTIYFLFSSKAFAEIALYIITRIKINSLNILHPYNLIPNNTFYVFIWLNLNLINNTRLQKCLVYSKNLSNVCTIPNSSCVEQAEISKSNKTGCNGRYVYDDSVFSDTMVTEVCN